MRSGECPACGGTALAAALSARDMYDGTPVALSRCAGCGTLRTDDGRPPDALAGLYHYEGGAAADARFVGPLEPVLRALRRARLRALGVGEEPGRALDVGCGRGVTLAALAERGWEVLGTEVDADVAASARARLGERVVIGDAETGGLAALPPSAGPFDLISFWHVLEHLPEPRLALERAARRLAPGGRVVIAVPNAASWQARFGGAHWLHLDVPRHRWHFPASALELLAERVGLRVTRSSHFSLEYGPYGLLQTALSRAGLGHALFTRVLRPGASRLRDPALWLHAGLAAPIAAAAALSLPLEALAAAMGAGGAVVVHLQVP